ncbi:MAG: zinc-binding dehydrogenase [Lachnospiraceae bacterium]|nr:zinc-binding dehydrogenase [Lachnospiraceae bacterium]
MLSKRAYLVKEGTFEIREEDLIPGPTQVLVKIKLCGLCNWELNHWKGTSESYRSLYPMVPGHEWVGEVVEKGELVHSLEIGDIVTEPGYMGGFGEYNIAEEEHCYKVLPHIPLDNAIGEPLKCITTVVGAAAPKIGDYGLIQGCGPMGLWCTQAMAGNLMTALIAVDIDDSKLELAKKYGATHTINSMKEDVVARIKEITNGHMCDFVIEGTGIPRLLNTCMSYLKNAGRLVLMSSHEGPCDSFDFRPAIERGISIIVAHPPYAVVPTDDMRRAVSLINNGTFHNEDIITHRFKLEQISEAFETLEHKPKNYIKGVVEL